MRVSLPRRRSVAATAAVAAVAALLAPAAPASAAPRIVVGPGSEISVLQSETAQGMTLSTCTLAFIARTPAGQRVGLTAGHCGRAGQQVVVPVPGQAQAVTPVGRVARSSDPKSGPNGEVLDPSQADWATVTFDRGVTVVNRKGNIQSRKVGRAAIGQRVCAQGRSTGWRCGTVIAVSGFRVLTDVRGAVGDSGGPLIRLSDGAAVGITTRGVGRTGALQEFIDLGYVLGAAGGLRLEA